MNTELFSFYNDLYFAGNPRDFFDVGRYFWDACLDDQITESEADKIFNLIDRITESISGTDDTFEKSLIIQDNYFDWIKELLSLPYATPTEKELYRLLVRHNSDLAYYDGAVFTSILLSGDSDMKKLIEQTDEKFKGFSKAVFHSDDKEILIESPNEDIIYDFDFNAAISYLNTLPNVDVFLFKVDNDSIIGRNY